METTKQHRQKYLSVFFAAGIFIVFLFGFGWYSTVAQNHQKFVVKSTDNNKSIIAIVNPDGTKIDKWETSILISMKPHLEKICTGETFNCSISNRTKNNIKNWNLKINIKQECYLNQFWCGDFEVHQFRNGVETVQLIKNSEQKVSGLIVEHNEYSANIMIHLLPQDYLIYYPSIDNNENIIKKNKEIGIGCIFYFQNNLDLTDYEITYSTDLKLYETLYFNIAVVLLILWVIGLLFLHIFLVIEKRIINETNTSIKNISIMAELYLEVHMINLESNTGYLVKGESNNLMFDFIGHKIQDCFKKYIEEDCKDQYKNDLTNFFDLKRVVEFLNHTQSISFEYESKNRGWCLLRFFKMEKNNKITQLIFTVQDINEEKKKYEQEQENIKQNDFNQFFHNTFMETFTGSTAELLNVITGLNKQLGSMLTGDAEKNMSVAIDNGLEHYNLLQNCVYDMYALETGTFKLKNENYKLTEAIDRVVEILTPFHMNKEFQFIKNIDPNIPPVLEGDRKRLMQILLLLLFSSFFITKKGTVKLSIFAKQNGDNEELLFSIRDSAEGFTEEEMKEVYSFLAGARINSFDNPSLVYLKIIDGILKNMGSELKVVSVHNSGTEFYFSVNQKVIEKA